MVLLEEIIDEEPETRSSISNSVSDQDSEPKSTVEHDSHHNLKEQAEAILQGVEKDPTTLPDALHRVLIEVIKPLFLTSKHPSLTSTGRKNLVSEQPQVGRFVDDSIFDDSRPWKNKWTTSLLETILNKYIDIEDSKTQKQTIEAHFHLLVPPILNFIDDVQIIYKVRGCKCLTQLCTILIRNDSDMMKRTGLTDVFVDALRKTFTYLPTLTPEDESLDLIRAVYPAYLALVDARYIILSNHFQQSQNQVQAQGISSQYPIDQPNKPTSRTSTPSNTKPITLSEISKEITSRQALLTQLFRHSLLYALSHLSTGTGHGTGQSPQISTFLLSQIHPLTYKMGIYAVQHLQTLIPLLCNILHDPFSLSASKVLNSAIEALQSLTKLCWPRIRERWWTDCLSALVSCYLNVVDEFDSKLHPSRKEELMGIQGRISDAAKVLEKVVDNEEFAAAKSDILLETPVLRDMFEYNGG